MVLSFNNKSFALLWLSKVDEKALLSVALTYMCGIFVVLNHMAQNAYVKMLMAMFVLY